MLNQSIFHLGFWINYASCTGLLNFNFANYLSDLCVPQCTKPKQFCTRTYAPVRQLKVLHAPNIFVKYRMDSTLDFLVVSGKQLLRQIFVVPWGVPIARHKHNISNVGPYRVEQKIKSPRQYAVHIKCYFTCQKRPYFDAKSE